MILEQFQFRANFERTAPVLDSSRYFSPSDFAFETLKSYCKLKKQHAHRDNNEIHPPLTTTPSLQTPTWHHFCV